MPIYEYRCQACGHELEALQRFSDAPLHACPKCGKDALFKLVSAAGFQLKGSGWYATDFRDSGKKPAGKEVATSDAKVDGSEAKSNTGSEAAAKSETKSAGDAPAVPAGPTPTNS
jgi:putative FmdB family regulatory protein